ncbi:MAG: hypothetical protein WBC80_29025, partial [Isosphaeraceae bacterium]
RQEELSHELITVASLMYVRRLHPGISFDTARARIAEHAADPARLQDLSGRIMAFRLSCCFERLKRVGLPGAGRRPSCLLLRQRGPVQGSAERRDPAVRLLLGATHRPAPAELIFDSRLTTHANLNRLNRKGIWFITLRRRSAKLLRELAAQPASAWWRIELDGVSRAYRTPRVLDRKITLPDYEGPLRQLAVTDLGHEEPTLLITNQLGCSAAPLISRYARRMVIENGIEDGIDFFHMDALSSAVALKVNCDLQLTLMASSLYRVLGGRIGHGYETAKSRHLFRDFIDATATVTLGETEVVVRFQKRAHNPLLLAAGFDKTQVKIPWLGDKSRHFVFG